MCKEGERSPKWQYISLTSCRQWCLFRLVHTYMNIPQFFIVWFLTAKRINHVKQEWITPWSTPVLNSVAVKSTVYHIIISKCSKSLIHWWNSRKSFRCIWTWTLHCTENPEDTCWSIHTLTIQTQFFFSREWNNGQMYSAKTCWKS